MQVVFVEFWQEYEPGDQAELPENIAKKLVADGIAVLDPAAQPAKAKK